MSRAILATLTFLLTGLLAHPATAANTNQDYASAPLFISNTVAPNVLLLMDNSGSMGLRAYCGTPTHVLNNTRCDGAFGSGTSYAGLFDQTRCYAYESADTRFRANDTAKASISAACPSTLWDGNFLNYLSLRRFDAVKKAMIGGNCVSPRAASGDCPPSGSPSLVTIKSQTVFASNACCLNVATPGIPFADTAGRVPDSVRSAGASPAFLFFVVRGTPTPLAGSFCVTGHASDLTGAGDTNKVFPTSTCNDTGTAFTEQTFAIRVAVETPPTGVIQDLGDKARFGLMEFKGNDGSKVLTPIGARQSIDFTGTTLETFATNKAAMIDSVEESFPSTNTPLGESLYEGIRYVAQVNSSFSPTSYVYPLAFSPGKPLGTAGAGSLGPSEISALGTGETCPAGYLDLACGRDPYFFGANHTPAWASPSTSVPCCKTFIILFTDGEPTNDASIPAALQDYAHAVHGRHCTGGNATIHAPNGTCNTNNATPAATLLGEHKTDYASAIHALDDVAYWGHVTDLRQSTVPVLNEPGHDLPGLQNVTVYSFFAFGNITGREILMQAAKQGGFDDQNNNGLPDLPGEYDRVNNTTGAAVPDGLPDTYFESQNVDDLKDKLLAAITSILQKAASGTSVSVLSTSTTGTGAIYQAYFFPSTFVTTGAATTEVTWTGYLHSLFLDALGNLREDFSAPHCTGPPDGRLVLAHDCIVKFRFDAATGDVKIDRYSDDNGDGLADDRTGDRLIGNGVDDVNGDGQVDPNDTVGIVSLHDLKPAWEAGRRLALLDPGTTCASSDGGVSCRRLLTWADHNNDGLVGPDANEAGEFRPDRAAALCPYLGGARVAQCTSTVSADRTAALAEAENIIRFVRGEAVPDLRPRELPLVNDAGASVIRTWKLGDIVHSTPLVVGAPTARYDVIYGDVTYATFFQRYQDRRQVVYAGGNDGMLHAFNGGFFTTGDLPGTPDREEARFTTTPQPVGSTTPCTTLPCSGKGTAYAYRPNSPPLGAELWGFLPQDLLPHLRWLTQTTYTHVAYVDLKPRVTDARIFADDADHPGGWGTILIGGFRFGGSCARCTAAPRTVTADFNGDGNTTSAGDTRVFLSSYFVLDITNPEKDPVLLWTFRDQDLGLTTAEPTVIRVNPADDVRSSHARERWFVVFGTGPTHYDATSAQTAKFFVVDLATGPRYQALNQTSGTINGLTCSPTTPCLATNITHTDGAVRVFSTGVPGSLMGNLAATDFNLDFRVDVIYAGSAICRGATLSPCSGTTPQWHGVLWRLTTNQGNPNPDTWGITAGCVGSPRCPSTFLSRFSYTGAQATTCATPSPCLLGPVLTTPTISADDNGAPWIYVGTGRYFDANDKTNSDLQHVVGIKDCFLISVCPDQTVEHANLFNASSVVVCTTCAQPNNLSLDGGSTFTTTFDGGEGSLLNTLHNLDGWFTALPVRQERMLSPITLLGGTLYFTTYTPTADLCSASGTGLLYALYYQTGSPYKKPSVGETQTVAGNTLVDRSRSMGSGLPSRVAIQIGQQGVGESGNGSSRGCRSRVTGISQSSTSALTQTCLTPANDSWSRMLSWRDL